MINGKQVIEIRKAGFVNKGAELMLYAVLEKMKTEFPDAIFVMAPTSSAPYLKRAKLEFLQKAQYWKKGFQLGFFARIIPKEIREMYGIVLNKDIDIVIDASGFSYSDQWGKFSCLEMADSSKRWKKNGAKVILMPQAFGPFEGRLNKFNIRRIVKNVDLIFARDNLSFKYLITTSNKNSKIKMAPDFTNLLKGKIPKEFDLIHNQFCVVPNYRMIDKIDKKESDLYLPFMIEITKYLFEKGHKPFLLVHEGQNDKILAQKIRESVNPEINIIEETNPIKIKGILGASSGSVGSRFHGLVSALSQGVPALGTGWSHKYIMLFEDYDFPEGLLDINMSKDKIHEKLDLILNVESKALISNKIKIKSEILKQQSRAMWELVFKALKSD
jgi:polysaccharide pyruvyl transferase WcaK-like protein